MPIFRDSNQFYENVGELMDRAKMDPNVGPKIAKSKIVIQFRYTEPDAMTTVNAKDKPTQENAYVDVIQGDCDLNADVSMSMKADVAHQFWLGKINLVSALAKGEIKATGPIPKILKLLPAIKPLYDEYPKILRENGMEI
jgi:alkyl sulfatase BDS1-like metallo-beta-lactamase superfamily hydrolase